MLIGALELDLALETLGVFLKNLAPPEILSTTSHQCYLGNKYLSHAYLSSIQPCVGCIMAWIHLFCKCCVSCKVLLENIYIANVSKLRWLHMVGVYKIMFMIHLSQICQFSNLLHINSSKCSHVQYWWSCKIYSFFVILVAFLNAFQLSPFPCW